MSDADSGAFGRALAKLRLARGYTQQQVSARIPTYYSDAGAYGRIERGERHPDRDAVIAILVRGLLILDASEINRMLLLAEFEPLSLVDVERFDLPKQPPLEPSSGRIQRFPDWRSVLVVLGSLAGAGLLALLIPGQAAFALLTSGLYAALYVVSLYLESAFEPERFPRTTTAAVLTFGAILVTSMAALATDRILVDAGSSLALPSALAIFLLAGVVQFLLVRRTLAATPTVPASFQTHTAQSAHLKNTAYFLLVVVLFWQPAFHCVLTFTREIRVGQADWVHQMLEHDLMIGRGIIALSVRWLLGLLLSTFLTSLYMGHVLLDRLQPHVRLNTFTILFYLRAFVFFLLCLIAIGWYAYSLSELS